MISWLVEDRNELFLYDGRNLHQLNMSPGTKEEICKQLSLKEEARPINDELAYKLLRKKPDEEVHQVNLADIQQIEKVDGNPANHVLQHGKWYMYKIGERKAILFPGNSSNLVINSLASIDSTASEWDWLLELYGKYTVAAHQQDGDQPKTLLLDLASKYITRELSFLFEYNLDRVTDYSTLFLEQEIIPVDRLTALEDMETKLLHTFVFHQNIYNQIPYKVTTSEKDEFYVGEYNVEQILQASYRNLELLLQKDIRKGTWLVVEDEAQLLCKVSILLFQEDAIENSFISIEKLNLEDKVMDMLQRFENDINQLTLQIQKDTQLNIYRMRCLKGNTIGTNWIYGYDAKEMMIEVLQHYFGLHVQNSIEFGKVNNLIHLEEDVYPIPEARTEKLVEALNKRFTINVLNVPNLLSNNLYLLNLQRK